MVGSVPFLLSSFRIAPSAVRSLQDNYHFLYPITKSDVCSELEKIWPKAITLMREKSLFVPIESPLYSALFHPSLGRKQLGNFISLSRPSLPKFGDWRLTWTCLCSFGLSMV
jgi:hypothetical protein